MGNEGTFELSLKNAELQDADDPQTTVRFYRALDNREIGDATQLAFPPAHSFTLPAFPQEKNLRCEITPSRFRIANTGFFTLTTTDIRHEPLTVLRQPERWRPEFVLWERLAGEFTFLKTVLGRSPGIRVKGGEVFGSLVEGTYDDITDQNSILAKMALLNLYFALTFIKEPTTGTESWFSFVDRIFLIDRERFMALVNPAMATIVRTISDDIGSFPDYKRTNALNHLGGIREGLPAGFTVPGSGLVSIKNKPEHANIQLTMAPARDSNGRDVMILDADIDEDGRLLEHLADLIKHVITGGTHPIDIHEFLVLAHRGVDLGYDLILRR